MIEAIKGLRGEELALCKCDDCAAEESVRATHGHGHGGQGKLKMTLANERQPLQKLEKAGWALVKGKLRCPKCEAKRKETNVIDIKPKAETPREPTRAQKREIMDMLESAYDVDAERYTGGDTDETVAEVLKVMPGWVAQIREEFFGPDGGNENIEELVAKLGGMEREIKAVSQAALALREKAEKKLVEVSAMRVELDRIKKAVGPRVMRQA